MVSPVQYWEKVLGSPNQYWDRFYRFPRPVLVIGSIISQSSTRKSPRFPSLLLGNYSRFPSPCSTAKRFYKFLSPLQGKGSLGSLVQYCVKVVYVLKSNTGKRF